MSPCFVIRGEKKREVEMERGEMERCRRKKSRDVMTGSRSCSRLQFIPAVASADQTLTVAKEQSMQNDEYNSN